MGCVGDGVGLQDAGFQLFGDGDQDIEHGLLAALRLAARLHRGDRTTERAHEIGAGRLGGQILAQPHEQRAIERARSTADLHDQHGADALQKIRPGLGAEIGGVGQHGVEAALHVEAVVAVADRLVKGRQLVGMAFDRGRHRLHQLSTQVRTQSHPAQLLRSK